MGLQEEVNRGIGLLKGRIERGGRLKVARSEPLSSRMANYFEVREGDKAVDFVLSYEFLSDLPGTQEYQHYLEEYASTLEKRFEQPNPLDFYCRSGSPINFEISWPISVMPDRDASYVKVTLEDPRFPQLVAKCTVVFINPLVRTALTNPFARQKAIINRLRQAMDRQEVRFYGRAGHPESLQQVEFWSAELAPNPVDDSDIVQFISGKVYWLGFRRQDKDARVWIADLWDAEYLGVDIRVLRQAAQIQQARDVIQLYEGDIAQPGRALLLSQPENKPRTNLVFVSGSGKTSQMIRHALREVLPGAAVVSRDETGGHRSALSDSRALIEKADFIVFDISEENPNVLFDLGFAQGMKKQFAVLMPRDVASNPPFDLRGLFYLPYDRGNPTELTSRLSNYIERYWGLPVGH